MRDNAFLEYLRIKTRKRRAKRKTIMSGTSGRKAGAARIQSGHHQHNEHHAENNELEDVIMRAHGIVCSVKVTPEQVEIRVPSYVDFLLAKSAIRGRVSAEIVRA